MRRRSKKNIEIKKQELQMMKELWDERPHICEVTGEPINFFSPWNFHHMLSKGAYPKFYLEKKNILICLPEIHHEYHCNPKQRKFEWVNLYVSEVLKPEYNSIKDYNVFKRDYLK